MKLTRKRLVAIVVASATLATAAAFGIGLHHASADVVLAGSRVTTTTETPTATTTELPTTTTTTLPAAPSFVVLCPASPAQVSYVGKPVLFKIGYQDWVGTNSLTLDISWGDGQTTRYTSLATFDTRRDHFYARPGTYQVNALLVDGFGRTASSSCTIDWVDSLARAVHKMGCAMNALGGNWVQAPDGTYQQRQLDPACAG